MPRPLPFLLNLALAAALGAALGGWPGLVGGAAALALLFAFIGLVRRLRANEGHVARSVCAIGTVVRTLVGAMLAPPVVIATLATSLALYVWERTAGRMVLPALTISVPLGAALGRIWRLLVGLFAPEALPLTALNALLLLVLATVALGIEVAFYAALAAVPILIVALAMVAIDSSRDPEEAPRRSRPAA